MSRTRHGCVNHVNASRDICPRPIKKQFRKGCKKQAARILLDPGRLVQDRLRLAHSPFKSRTHGSAMAYTWPWPPVRTGALSASRAVSGLRRVCVNQQLTWRVPIARGTMQILVCARFSATDDFCQISCIGRQLPFAMLCECRLQVAKEKHCDFPNQRWLVLQRQCRSQSALLNRTSRPRKHSEPVQFRCRLLMLGIVLRSSHLCRMLRGQ